ncbi:MAG: rhodanese-like domain-containing protein [Gammaproteobacteria bacterium]|nr:MAG: rhodanese-like domain-containing protein [Gammaproteobacteria bacterium]
MDQAFEFIGNHAILVGTFAVLLALFIRNEASRGGRTATAQELINLVNREHALVLDVRDAREFAEGHIVDALNIPHASVASRLTELEKHKGRPVAIVCKMGQHAGSAGTILRKSGFERVLRLSGGMAEWRNQNLPVVKGRDARKSGKGKTKQNKKKRRQHEDNQE